MCRSKSNPQIVPRPQDVVLLLRLSLARGPAPSYAALADELKLTASEIHAGVERAMAFYLLYPTVPEAAARNQRLYELLALLDAVRGGSPRERALALTELDKQWTDQGGRSSTLKSSGI